MVILAAAVIIATSAFIALVAWRLYRIMRELQHDVEPVVASMRDTADTVTKTTAFVGSGAVSPAVSVVGFAGGLAHLARVVDQARRARRSPKDTSGGS